VSEAHSGRDRQCGLGRPIGAWPAAFVVRLCVALLALVAACAAAAVFLTAVDAALDTQWRDVPLAIMVPADIGIRFLVIAVCLSLPGLAVAMLSEYFGIRSALFFTAAGAAIPAGYLLWSGRAYAYFDHLWPTAEAAPFLLSSAAAGVIAGLVYWWIAGRKAEAWRNVTIGRGAVILACAAIVAGLAVLVAPSAAGLYGLFFPADTDASWDSKVGWRLCNAAIAAWPSKAAPACWKLDICDNEGGLSAAERRRLKRMMAVAKCES
jgi:hypothetical protein